LAMLMGTTNGPSYELLSMGNVQYSSEVQAMVSYFGPSNMTDMLAQVCLGNNYTQEQAKAASPYYKIDKNSPPLFLTHGKNDQVVPFQQSLDMEAKAKSIIGDENVTSVYYDNAPHASIGAYDTREAAEKVEAFLTTHLKNLKKQTQATSNK
jgi:Dipeptidyl aminopeptidases/acylaminoacyl-peptidases